MNLRLRWYGLGTPLGPDKMAVGGWGMWTCWLRGGRGVMLERLQLRQLERQEKETGSSHPIASATAVQAATLHSTPASALLPSAVGLSAPIGSTNALAARPLSTRPVEAGVLQQEQRQPAAVPSASNAPSRIVQQQPRQQVATGPEPARTAAVALPSDARMHFFLSHCQGTGGDQTNAIYLELRQLGFACWYSALLCAHTHISLTHLPSVLGMTIEQLI
jgi:hypothetical protein